MNTNFQKIKLDVLRYSLVWESYEELRSALQPSAGDRFCLPSSAGCNVLNLCLEPGESIHAVDLNPVQNQLLRLKIFILKHTDADTWLGLLGFLGSGAYRQKREQLWALLSQEQQQEWHALLHGAEEGLLLNGKLERYLHQFVLSLKGKLSLDFVRLFQCADLAEQKAFWREEFDQPAFKAQFVDYFDRAKLGKARDPKLYQYVAPHEALRFYERFEHFLEHSLLAQSFYAHFFFWGLKGIPQKHVAPCYRSENFDRLRQNLHRIEIHQQEIMDFLQSVPGQNCNKVSLSNIFEYVAAADFEESLLHLSKASAIPRRLVYWNLLNMQEVPALDPIQAYQNHPQAADRAFYLSPVRCFEIQTAAL